MQEHITGYSTKNESDYWSTFYEHHDFNKGSSFFEFINDLPELPSVIVDIGCGQGRDSFAFAQAGNKVVGLDRSDTGIERANAKTKLESLDDNLLFAVCDVSDEKSLIEKLSLARETANGEDVVYYMRFFLHSIPADIQNTLLATIAKQAKQGDVLAVEFRTDKDEELSRVFGDAHYRRYQNAADFSKQLQDEFGWDIVFEEEAQGLSPYKDEDPVLYRAVAIRALQD